MWFEELSVFRNIFLAVAATCCLWLLLLSFGIGQVSGKKSGVNGMYGNPRYQIERSGMVHTPAVNKTALMKEGLYMRDHPKAPKIKGHNRDAVPS
jgi:hypothetical protein